MDKKSITLGIAVIGIAVALGIVLAGVWNSNVPASLSGAPQGSFGYRATSSAQIVIATEARTIFATSSDQSTIPNFPDTCYSRVITVGTGVSGTGIMLTFDDKDTPTTAYGHWQAASTTVAYDGELYGCGRVKALGNSTFTITTTEF